MKKYISPKVRVVVADDMLMQASSDPVTEGVNVSGGSQGNDAALSKKVVFDFGF